MCGCIQTDGHGYFSIDIFSNKIKIFFNYYFEKNLQPLHFIKLEFAQVKKRYEYPSEAHTNTEQNFVTCLI